ncbi:MAG: response regulator [Verrucomicrobiales bacterium]|nr:response regulator [Verrucomicrobiales bacterium]
MKTALLIEDDESFRTTVGLALKARGFCVLEAVSGAVALERVEAHGPPDGILLDMRLGRSHGMKLIPELRAHCQDSRIVVLTGYGSIPESMEALRLGADDYLLKPAGIDSIIGALSGKSVYGTRGKSGDSPSLARVEWEHIQRILHDSDGNISQAAKRLGIDRRTLQRKLAKQPPES